MDTQKKILIVDNDNELADSIRAAFPEGKCKVIGADSFVSGIQKVFQHHPDLILYNRNLDPSAGNEIFKALRYTSSFSHVAVHFFKDKADEEIQDLINHKEKSSLLKFKKAGNNIPANKINGEVIQKVPHGVDYDFNTLFNLSPVGMFIFDKKGIYSMNQMLVMLLKINEHDISTVGIGDIFNDSSAKLILSWIKKYPKDENTSFCNQVILKDKTGESVRMNLMIHELKKEGSSVHFLGLLQAVQGSNGMVSYQMINEVCNLLKRENIEVSGTLEKKITQTIKQRIKADTHQKKSFFTRREDEVLRLSMEGLSIKIIADKLHLSTRTVEKYRTKLMLKSGAKNIAEVIVFSLKNDLVKI